MKFLKEFLNNFTNGENIETIDITTEEGYSRINEIIDMIEKNPFGTFFASMLGIDLDDLREFIKEKYEDKCQEQECECQCKCNEKCDCDCDCCEDEFDDEEDYDDEDDDLAYSEKITPQQLRTINTLVKEFVGELEVNADEDFSETERYELSSLLCEFASYVMLR